MRRKVIQIADSTQLVSIPRAWAKKFNIKKGDEVEVVEAGPQLIISPAGKEGAEKKIEITIPTVEKFLKRMIWSPYAQGVTELTVNFSDRKVFDKVSAEVGLLIGWEIVQQGTHSCRIKSVATILENDLENIIRRIFHSTSLLMKDMSAAIASRDYTQLNALKGIEETNNKLTYFSLRLLTKRGYTETNKTHSVYFILMLVEAIVDNLRDICALIVSNKLALGSETIALLDSIGKLFEQVHALFYKFSTEALVRLNTGVKETTKRIHRELDKPSKDAVILANLYDILKMISHASKEIHY